MADRDALPLPLEVRARLAELELELSEGKSRAIVLFLLVFYSGIMREERRPPLLPPSVFKASRCALRCICAVCVCGLCPVYLRYLRCCITPSRRGAFWEKKRPLGFIFRFHPPACLCFISLHCFTFSKKFTHTFLFSSHSRNLNTTNTDKRSNSAAFFLINSSDLSLRSG